MTATSQPLTNTFIAADGLNVFYRNWKPAGQPIALVVIAHGFNSHGGYYEWVADQLTAQD